MTEDALKEYGLTLRLRDGSDATMTAALNNTIENNEAIVVTAWNPHWKFVRWDLKYLDDPKGVYGEPGQMHTFTRLGYQDEMPEAYEILARFEWFPDDMQTLMLMNEESDNDPYENAKKWLQEHPERVDEWLGR